MSLPIFCFTLDTEPDNLWAARANEFTHFSRVLDFHRGLSTLGCRPTYLTTSEVVEDRGARHVMEQVLATGTAEVGAHFHTWTRDWPFDVPDLGTPRVKAMAHQLGQSVEEQMLAYTCKSLKDNLGVTAVSYRGGRWSLSADSVTSMKNCGIRVDSTVCPGKVWPNDHPLLDSPDYRRSTRHVHYLDGGTLEPKKHGAILEIPVGAGFVPNRTLALSSSPAARVFRKLGNTLGKPTGHVLLRPAFHTRNEIRACLEDMHRSGIEVWVVMIHSSELGPNMYFSKESEIRAFIERCYYAVEQAVRMGATPMTMKEVREFFDMKTIDANGKN